VPDERVCRVIGGANHLNVELAQDAARGELRFGEAFVCGVPDFFCGGLFEEVFDSEVAAEFEVRPDVERIAERLRDGRRPRLEFLERRRVAGDVFFGNAGGAHRPPFVVVALEPDFVEVGEAAVFGDILGRQVAVVVNDALGRGDVVIERLRERRGEEEVLVEKSHAAKGARHRWCWTGFFPLPPASALQSQRRRARAEYRPRRRCFARVFKEFGVVPRTETPHFPRLFTPFSR
jgi:hypothetical protein